MRINGQVRQSCSALVDKLKWPITLEPMSKFPVMRDLSVDRSRMFDALKRVQAWVPVDGYHDLGPGEKILPDHQKIAYELSKCMTLKLQKKMQIKQKKQQKSLLSTRKIY